MSVIRGVKDRRFKFVQLLNDMFDDSNISLKAKGFLGHCLTKPSDWKFYVKQLCSNLKEGERAIYSVINECIDNGYAYRFQPRTENGDFLPWETVVSDSKYEIEQIKKEIESSPGFKKCLAHRRFADAQTADAQNVPPTNTCSLEIRKEQQQGNAAVSFDQEKQEAKSYENPVQLKPQAQDNSPGACTWHNSPYRTVTRTIYPCLEQIDISEEDKIEITRMYKIECVQNAIEWATDKDNPPKKGVAPQIKFACKRGLSKKDLPKPKLSTFEELKLYFENHGKYNQAECYLTPDYIAFERGHNQQMLKLDKFFSWKKFQDICESYGIKFKRHYEIK